ncbi:AtpZ/AtpI family protein [Janibacter melonis]|uniref:AtpZ/AtpI family protein n=1 Tax=Janibacter melonis TaxID=262209 RepID=UPI002095B253|nr:AtpZ/AtpI family protein [Janibacter melonis]
MSPLRRRSDTPQPRLVTRREGPSPDAHRWATDPESPNPAAQADALGATVLAYLISGPLLFGGIGWLLDRWLGTSLIVAVGALLGMGLSLYVIWLRYGTSQAPTSGGDTALPGAKPHNEENP